MRNYLLPKAIFRTSLSTLIVIVIFATMYWLSDQVSRKDISSVRTEIQLKERLTFRSSDHDVKEQPPDIYLLRHRQLEAVCGSDNHTGNTENILVYRNMSYGVVPKSGCTFWIRVFRFLHNDTHGRVLRSPMEMTRFEAHGGPRKMKMFRLQKESDRRVIMATTRFMVARNPFTRLYSAYVDKLVLPEYWISLGREIIKRRVNPSKQSLECGHDVSFAEFLKYITDATDPLKFNGHWRPIEHYCNPCVFKPDIVAKQETFSQDTQHILRTVGLGNLLKTHQHKHHVTDEIKNLVNWNYGGGIWGSNCIPRKQLAVRIWQTFNIHGYLEPGSEILLDKETLMTLNRNRLISLMVSSYISSGRSKKDCSRQRKRYLRAAYDIIPNSTIAKIVKIYRKDFQYFGYNTSIKSL